MIKGIDEGCQVEGCVGVLLVYSDHIAVYSIVYVSGSSQCGKYLIEPLVLAMEHAIEACLCKFTALYEYLCAVATLKVYGYIGKSLAIKHYGAIGPKTIGCGTVLYTHVATLLLKNSPLVGRQSVLIVTVMARSQSYSHTSLIKAYHSRMVGGIVAEVELSTEHLYIKTWRLHDEWHRLVAMHLKVAFTRELHMAVAYTETLRIL